MNAWHRWSFTTLSAIVAVTGAVYFWMKDLLTPEDPFAVVNHPLQPVIQHLHVLAAPAFLVVFGMVFTAHVVWKLRTRGALLPSGLLSLVTIVLMAASGYLLEVAIDEAWRGFWSGLHLASGAVFTVACAVHLTAGIRRARRKQRVRVRPGILPACVLAAASTIALLQIVVSARHGPIEISRQVLLMGTRATLTTWDDDDGRGRQRLERLLETIEETEARLSTWRRDSEISRLNAAAGDGPRALSPTTCRLFSALDRWVHDTGGAFDPAIGPLTAVWDIHGAGRIPSVETLAAARALSGWARLSFDAVRCTVRLAAGATIDVGAFGKGDGLDAARAALSDDPAPWLIDLGGQIAVAGAPPRAQGWTISLAHPAERTAPLMNLTLTSGSLSTSSGSERDRWVRGTRVGHILDPHTGSPAPFRGSVSVWHESALVADVLSTALYVMGPRKGLSWAEAHGIAAVFAMPRADGTLERRASTSFATRFAETRLTRRSR